PQEREEAKLACESAPPDDKPVLLVTERVVQEHGHPTCEPFPIVGLEPLAHRGPECVIRDEQPPARPDCARQEPSQGAEERRGRMRGKGCSPEDELTPRRVREPAEETRSQGGKLPRELSVRRAFRGHEAPVAHPY